MKKKNNRPTILKNGRMPLAEQDKTQTAPSTLIHGASGVLCKCRHSEDVHNFATGECTYWDDENINCPCEKFEPLKRLGGNDENKEDK